MPRSVVPSRYATTRHGPISGPLNVFLAALAIGVAGHLLHEAGGPALVIVSVVSVAGSLVLLGAGIMFGGGYRRWGLALQWWGIISVWPLFVIEDGLTPVSVLCLFTLVCVLGVVASRSRLPEGATADDVAALIKANRRSRRVE